MPDGIPMPTRSRPLPAALLAAAVSAGVWAAASALVAWRPAPPAAFPVPEEARRDLAEVRREGILRVAVVPDEVGFARRRGQPEGFAYELAREVASRLAVRAEIVPVRGAALAIRRLREGSVDLIALADPGPRPVLGGLAWTPPIEAMRPVVVGRGAAAVRSAADLRGRTLAVRRHDALERWARRLVHEAGGTVKLLRLPPATSARELAVGAARRRYDFALLDEARGRLEAAVVGPLEVSRPLGPPFPVRWALRPSSPDLLRAVGAALEEARRAGRIAALEQRYLENPVRLQALRRHRLRPGRGPLSPWDDLFRAAAAAHGLDWRLLAAVSFAESGYDPWVVSPRGAVGLLQVMPGVAAHYGIDDPFDPAQNAAAGSALLAWLRGLFDEIPEPDRTRFVLAAYNMGLGHLADARRLARRHGLDPDRWEGNVERMLPLLEDPGIAASLPHGRADGAATLRYVERVLELYARFGGARQIALAGTGS
ncbi:MAG: hypothetical protein D6718_08410 [Acidobacteria bacterium]|nr:MAG: hypothetical protein D6718_08410 [Acidobacteriota bacterium]